MEIPEKIYKTICDGINAVRFLINASHGVVGLHLNGDTADWQSLKEGGYFETWLLPFNRAENAIRDERCMYEFRGKIIQGIENAGHWVYWGLSGTDMLDVIDKETIGMFTGKLDKNGEKVWGGDRVRVNRQDSFSSYNEAVVVYADNLGAFLIKFTKKPPKKSLLLTCGSRPTDGEYIYGYLDDWALERIGTIYDEEL